MKLQEQVNLYFYLQRTEDSLKWVSKCVMVNVKTQQRKPVRIIYHSKLYKYSKDYDLFLVYMYIYREVGSAIQLSILRQLHPVESIKIEQKVIGWSCNQRLVDNRAHLPPPLSSQSQPTSLSLFIDRHMKRSD